MKITIEFSTDNAAFEDNPNEISEALKQAARKIMLEWATEDDWQRAIFDTNGNKIGTVSARLQI